MLLFRHYFLFHLSLSLDVQPDRPGHDICVPVKSEKRWPFVQLNNPFPCNREHNNYAKPMLSVTIFFQGAAVAHVSAVLVVPDLSHRPSLRLLLKQFFLLLENSFARHVGGRHRDAVGFFGIRNKKVQPM